MLRVDRNHPQRLSSRSSLSHEKEWDDFCPQTMLPRLSDTTTAVLSFWPTRSARLVPALHTSRSLVAAGPLQAPRPAGACSALLPADQAAARVRCGGRRHSNDPVHRRPATTKPLRRPCAGVLLRWHDRRADHRPRAHWLSKKVISRTSVMHYKKTDKTLPQIASKLNADGLIEGSVQRSGDHVRVSAQLIYGPADKHLWDARRLQRSSET